MVNTNLHVFGCSQKPLDHSLRPYFPGVIPFFNFQTSSRARHADYKFLIEIRLGCQEPGQPAGKIKITY
jgi:hypothetical protein